MTSSTQVRAAAMMRRALQVRSPWTALHRPPKVAAVVAEVEGVVVLLQQPAARRQRAARAALQRPTRVPQSHRSTS